MNFLRQFFSLPQFSGDHMRTRQAQLLGIFLNCMIFGMPILIVGNALGNNVPILVNVINFSAILIGLGLRYWLTWGNLAYVAIVTALIALLGITLSIMIIGTIRTPSTAIFLLVIVASGFVFNQRTVILLITLSSLIVLALIVTENAGLLPEPDTSVAITQWVTYTALFILGGSLTYSATLTIHQALERADHELERRRRTEAVLEEKENQLRIITDNMHEMVLLLDTEGHIRYVNPSSYHQLGYKPEDLVGKFSLDFLHQEDHAFIINLLQKVTKGANEPTPIEFRGQHANGQYIHLEATGQILFEQDQATGIVAVSRDVTTRKRMESALRRQNSIPANLYRFTLDILRHQAVQDLLQMVVLRAAELLDAPYGELMLLEGEELVVYALTPNQPFIAGERSQRDAGLLSWQAVITGLPAIRSNCGNDVGLTDKDDKSRLKAVAAFPILQGERCLGVLAVGRKHEDMPFDEDEIQAGQLFAQLTALALDNAQLYAAAQAELNDRKQAEESLRQSNTILQAQNEELDAFAHTVAHDLKNPISIIFGYAEFLLEDIVNIPATERQQALAYIYKNATKVNSIIESLLVLAGVRKQIVEPEPLDMNPIVDEALKRLYAMIQETKATISISDREAWPLVMGYAPWIEEVWVNYLSNALKYGGRPPRVELTAVRQPDASVRFNVCDNGVSLVAFQQERLFAPFERLGQKQTTGHGLGLSIVRRIIEKLGGQVGVESLNGQGNVFYFILPPV